MIGLDAADVLPVSAKEGIGIDALLERVVEVVPPPRGDPDGAAARAGLRLLVRPLRRRDHAGARRRRPPRARPAHPHDGEGLRARGPGAPRDRPAPARASRRSRPARSAWWSAGIKTLAEVRIGDTLTDARAPGRRAAARLPREQADGLHGPLPGGPRRLREPEARAREAAAERRLARLRARDERRARLRLPLRLPRLPALGDHPGAARARVHAEPDLDRADGALPRRAAERRGEGDRHPGGAAGAARDRPRRGADHLGHHPRAARVRRRGAGAVRGAARRAEGDAATTARACRCATSCRSPRWCSTSTTASRAPRAATARSTTSSSATARPTSSSSTCW